MNYDDIKKIYSIEKIKRFRGHEGDGFNCDLYEGSRKIALIIDEGDGGTLYDEVSDYPAFERLKDLCAQVNFSYTWESFIYDYIEELSIIKQCKTKTLFTAPDMEEGEYGTLNIKYGPEAIKYLKQNYKEVTIINEKYIK